MSASQHARGHQRSTLRPHGRHATLEFRRFFPHAPERVWDAITDPAALRQWFLTEAEVEHRVGGRLDMVTSSAQIHATGRVLAWDPPKVYEYEWNVAPRDTLPAGEQTVVRWELASAPGGTLVSVTHRNLTLRTARVYRGGLGSFLDRLDALLAGDPLPDWGAGIRQQSG